MKWNNGDPRATNIAPVRLYKPHPLLFFTQRGNAPLEWYLIHKEWIPWLEVIGKMEKHMEPELLHVSFRAGLLTQQASCADLGCEEVFSASKLHVPT